jgi:hypothetical protein
MRFRLSPSRYINTHSASGARRNLLSMMGVILPRRPLERSSWENVVAPPGVKWAPIGLLSVHPVRQ